MLYENLNEICDLKSQHFLKCGFPSLINFEKEDSYSI